MQKHEKVDIILKDQIFNFGLIKLEMTFLKHTVFLGEKKYKFLKFFFFFFLLVYLHIFLSLRVKLYLQYNPSRIFCFKKKK